MRKLLPCLLMLWLSSSVIADVIILNDGTRLEGKTDKTDGGWTITDATGKQTTVTADEVQSFELSAETGSPSDDSAPVQLASLRRAVGGMTDLTQIINRYQRFITENPGSPATKDAQADLDQWTGRQAQGQIKFGDKWMTRQEKEKVISQEVSVAATVRDLMAKGNDAAASDSIAIELGQNPDNAPVLYLRGIQLANRPDNAAARGTFDQVNAIIPGNGPTLNNLAVLQFRLKLSPAGVNDYFQAMQAKPDDEKILNNVAEALNMMSAAQSKIDVVKRASDLFNHQDAELAKTMEAKGLYRWGSNWVSKDIRDKCVALEKTNQAKLAALQQDMNQTQQRLNQDENRIQDDQNKIAHPSRYTSRNGILYDNGYDVSIQNRLEKDIARQQTDGQDAQNHEADLRTRMAQMIAAYPVPKFSGVQQLYGIEGTPLLEDQPTTLPSGQ